MKQDIQLAVLKSGDELAYQKIYEENREAFISFARKYGINEETIQDIYQDTIIVLYENIASGKLETMTSSLRTYLFSIGKYKILEHFRAEKKLVNVNLGFEFKEVEDSLDFEENILNERQIALKNQLKNLGERCRNILELFYLKNLTISEIKITEGYENENTVKAQKSRCLKQLKQLMIPQ